MKQKYGSISQFLLEISIEGEVTGEREREREREREIKKINIFKFYLKSATLEEYICTV